MENVKEKIEQAIVNLGLTVEGCLDVENNWYEISKGSASIFIAQNHIPIQGTNNHQTIVGFVSPLFQLNDNMPIEFYKELLIENSEIGDGTTFCINNRNYLQLKRCVDADLLSVQFVEDAIASVLFWSDKFDDELMEKYNAYLQ